MSASALKVLVTGGTSGLGLAMAAALAAAGAGRGGRPVGGAGGRGRRGTARRAGVELDVRDESSVARAVEAAWSRLDGIDMLVNNAGIGMRTVNPHFMTEPRGFWAVPAGRVPRGDRDQPDRLLPGGARGHAADAGRRRRPHRQHLGERVDHDRAGFVPYGPSRAGSEALSRIMAADLRDTGVTVNLLLPGGATVTGMLPPGARPGAAVPRACGDGPADRVAGLGRGSRRARRAHRGR